MPAPGYTYMSLGQARAELTQRLDDIAPVGGPYVHWTAIELNDIIIEAIRTYQALTNTYKQRTTFQVSFNGGIHGSSFYDLNAVSGLLSFKFTDQDLIRMTLAALLEPPLTADWVGTGQFSFEQIAQALQNRINRWLTDTGANITRHAQMVEIGPSASRIFLPEGVLDVRRAAWRIDPPAQHGWFSTTGAVANPNYPPMFQWYSYPGVANPELAGWVHNPLAVHNLIKGDFTSSVQVRQLSIADGLKQINLISTDPASVYSTLWRDDEFAMQAFHQPGTLTPGHPLVWGKFVMPPVGIDVYPPPANPGAIETLVVESGPQVGTNPATVFNSPTVLQIPEDYTWGMVFGALSDLMSGDGQARDPARAQYAESRYQESIELYKINPTLLMSQINGVPVWTGSVFEMDAFLASWQAQPGAPQFTGMAGRNLVAFGPTPNATYAVTMDIAADIPLPSTDTDFIQVNRGALDPLLDYAQHLASFKMAGSEFQMTDKLRQNFYLQCALENSRIKRANFYKSAFELPALRQQQEVPRI